MGGSASFGDCQGPVGTIRFSVSSGTFRDSITVELGSDVEAAEIRYTTDRTLPAADSPLYTGPLTFVSTTDLRAQPFVNGRPAGAPSTAIYVARNFDTTHDVPVIVLDSHGVPPRQSVIMGGAGGGPGTGPLVVREFVDVAFLAFEPVDGEASLADLPVLASPAATHLRGQSSAFYAKRPYRLELRDAEAGDRDCTLLGMPSESDWVLHSPFADKALIRNAFVYGLGRDMGLAAPRSAFAELYVNEAARPLESSDYQGLYLLVETIKVHPDRLDLERLSSKHTSLPAVSGGYVFKFDWQVTAIDQLLTCPSAQNCWNWLDVVEPPALATEQRSYLTKYLESAGASLHSKMPADPMLGYPSLFDTKSFVDHVIVNELTRNLDAYTRSQFFHKDRDGKLLAGPLWDFDLCAGVGSKEGASNVETSGFQYEANYGRMLETADWFWVMVNDPSFKAQLARRWGELRRGLLADERLVERIDELAAPLEAAAGRNFEKWDNLGEEKVSFFYSPATDTWRGQLETMRDWLLERAAFLDSSWK